MAVLNVHSPVERYSFISGIKAGVFDNYETLGENHPILCEAMAFSKIDPMANAPLTSPIHSSTHSAHYRQNFWRIQSDILSFPWILH